MTRAKAIATSTKTPAARSPRSAPAPAEVRRAEALHSAALRLLRLLKRQDHATGVGPAQLSALSVLVFAGPRRLGRLADDEGVRPPTMTRVVAALEAANLVARSPDPDDGRSIVLRATARGRSLLLAGRDARVRDLARRVAAAGWSAADREAVDRTIGLLVGLVEGRRQKTRTGRSARTPASFPTCG
jgi:DNA-binding MarR family transcriptional regulator